MDQFRILFLNYKNKEKVYNIFNFYITQLLKYFFIT